MLWDLEQFLHNLMKKFGSMCGFMQVYPISKPRLNAIHVKGNVSIEEKCQFAIVICEYK